jgi:Arc/MetJ-type ribon-helix-helix transcriptional regulator
MKIHRMTLEIPDSMRERMQKMKNDGEAASVAEVVRRSFSLYEFFLHSVKRGDKIFLRKADGSEHELVVIP